MTDIKEEKIIGSKLREQATSSNLSHIYIIQEVISTGNYEGLFEKLILSIHMYRALFFVFH